MDAFDEHVRAHSLQPIAAGRGSYFAFTGARPPDATFKSLGLERVVLAKHLSPDGPVRSWGAWCARSS